MKKKIISIIILMVFIIISVSVLYNKVEAAQYTQKLTEGICN